MDDRALWDLDPDPVAEALNYLAPHSAGAIVRESFLGTRRFDDFVDRTGLTRSAVAHRLQTLVARGILHRVSYQRSGERSREEYELTDKGRDLTCSVVALARWSQTWLLEPADMTVLTRHRGCGAEVYAAVTCLAGHQDLYGDDLVAEPGPAARKK